MEKLLAIRIVVICIYITTVYTKLELTNMKCETFDESILSYGKCDLKSVNRTYKYLALIIKFPSRKPLNDIKVNVQFFRKANGYKPFLYNISFDACKFLKNRKTNQIIQFFHKFFEKYSTINRTCPYGEQDEVIDKLPVSYIDHFTTQVLPVPRGDYAVVTTFYFDKKRVAKITVSASLT